MNRFCKLLSVVIFLSVVSCTPISSDSSYSSHIIFSDFTNQVSNRERIGDKSQSDFSHENRRNDFGGHRLSVNTNNFDSCTVEGFQHHFAKIGYTEQEVLNQRCLYMNDAFVKYTQTYSGYQDAIQKLHAELKSLNIIQKAWCVAKGTYCRKLQNRIAYLYKQLNEVKTISRDTHFYKAPASDKPFSSTKMASFDRAVCAEQFVEYKALEPIYDVYAPSLVIAINARSDIYRDIIANDSSFACVRKSYTLNNNIKELLSHHRHELAPFAHCSGDQLQQVIHQESLDILDRVDSLSRNSVLYDHQAALVDFTVAMVDYNHAGMTDKAMTIGDLCWTLLDYSQAIAEGAALGLYSAAHDILTNPIEATVCLVAGKQVLAYQLCKVLYNVADIGVTAIANRDEGKEKWNKYAAPLNKIIDAINKKEITVRDAIKGGTAFVVGYKAQGRLLGGLGKFCRTIQQKSISFVKNNSLLEQLGYLATPEGLLFKATSKSNKIKLGEPGLTASSLKKVVEDKILKKNTVLAAPILGEGVICQGDLRAKIQKYKEHIFSDDHKNRGILDLGKSKDVIMDALCEKLLLFDNKGFLREGNNQLRIMINGVDNIEIRCFIQNGEVISLNAFISTFDRMFSNFIDARNV